MAVVAIRSRVPHFHCPNQRSDPARVVQGRLVGPVTVSVGVGIFPEHGDTVEAVVRAADAAMYQAKQLGRNRVVLGGNKDQGLSSPSIASSG